MSKRRALIQLVLGSTLTVCGIWGAVIFHEFPMGFHKQTFWEDVLIFSAVAAIGLLLVCWAAVDMILTRRK